MVVNSNMLMKLIQQLKIISHSRWYWVLAFISGISLLGGALIYQHVLGERPCLLCIQIRLWLSLLILVSFAGLFVLNNRVINSVAHMLMALVAVGLTERSYQLLGTERGFVFGDCGFDLGLPAWLALEEWLPSVYYVHTSCGYTPEIVFGITIAEFLMVFSAGLLLLSAGVALCSFFKPGE